MVIEFTVHGDPVGKGRPKFARQGGSVRTYTPSKTANYEKLVRAEYLTQCRGQRMPDQAAIYLNVHVFYTIPKSTSKKRRQQMLDYEIQPTKKPDLDNVIKSICDAMNGVAYKDDAKIVMITASKYYSEDPRVEVTLYEMREKTTVEGEHGKDDISAR